jgi:hypothetical protein
VPDVNTSRRYNSAVRADHARRTRRTVLAAATELFVANGYAATTIAQIAEHAGVSRPTVFAIGAKPQLLKLARDLAIAGDDEPIPVAARAGFEAMRAAHDAESALRRYAADSARIGRRFGPLNEVLREAKSADPELAELWRTSEEQRLSGAEMVIKIARGKGRLKPGLSAARAAEVLWTLTDPGMQHRLVVDRGWSHAQFDRWYAATMVALLLP